MKRALQLALLGAGKVSPNPMVGALIVYKDSIIGEGYHKKYGDSHAELNAIQNVSNKNLLEKSTLYVNLEPCNHYGKNPPCTKLIIQSKIPKVVISTIDSHSLVNGNGKKVLIENGIDLVSDILRERGREINKRFFTFTEKKRPYIILKWAETSEGYLAQKNFKSKWISNSFFKEISS